MTYFKLFSKAAVPIYMSIYIPIYMNDSVSHMLTNMQLLLNFKNCLLIYWVCTGIPFFLIFLLLGEADHLSSITF